MYKIIEWAPTHFITEDRRAWPFDRHKIDYTLHVANDLYVVPVKRQKEQRAA